jgi:hypothetical protein
MSDTKDLLRANTWWRLKKKLEEEMLGVEREDDDFGFKTTHP